MRAILVTFVASILCACVGVDDRPNAEEDEPILGGVTDDSNNYPYVVNIDCHTGQFLNGEEYTNECSGTLIGPHTVLTAEHCRSDSLQMHLCQTGPTGPTKIGIGVHPTQTIAITSITPGPARDLNSKNRASRDIAVAKLVSGASGPFARVSASPPTNGQFITIVGYGLFAQANEPNCTDPTGCGAGTRRWGTSQVGTVTNTTADSVFSSTPTASNQTPCHVDSGSPALPSDGSPLILGVDSQGIVDGDCRPGAYWALASSEIAWITIQLLTPGSPIYKAYTNKLGGGEDQKSSAGYPVTEEIPTCGGTVAQLEDGALATYGGNEAFLVKGPILDEWNTIKASCVLGLPKSDEKKTSCGGGIFNDFQYGAITYSTAAKAHETHGPIRDKWAALGYECGLLGFPTSDMKPTVCDNGFYNSFERGAITWRSDIGAHETHGPIRAAWGAQNYECGCLGLPINDPVVTGSPTVGTTVQTFEHGTISMNNATNQTTVSCTNYCARASDGVFCGDSKLDGFAGTGDPKTLYTCHGHGVTGTQKCATDCYIQPAGHPDTCDACAFATDGVYCGNSTADGFPGSGIAKDRYFCHGHVTTEIDVCPGTCTIESSGPDECTCGGPTCGANCCPSGAYCGTSNQCCTTCGPGCPVC